MEYKLSSLSRKRIIRKNLFSFFLLVAMFILWFQTKESTFLIVGAFLVLTISTRWAAMIRGKVPLEIREDGISVRWLRTKSATWDELLLVKEYSEKAVVFSFGPWPFDKHILPWWRIEVDRDDVLAALAERAPHAFDANKLSDEDCKP